MTLNRETAVLLLTVRTQQDAFLAAVLLAKTLMASRTGLLCLEWRKSGCLHGVHGDENH